jgi:5-methylcytosine-specific restriction protein A
VPVRPRTPCTEPGCPALVERPGRCSRCARAADRELKARHSWRDYGRGWAKVRALVLAQEPACRVCGALSEEVDHIVPLRLGGHPRARSNLQALCHSCHSRKTARETGFGR